MASSPYRRAVAVVGEYTDRNGQTKKRYQTVGTMFRSDDGNLSLKLDCVPVGNGFNGWVSFFEIEDKPAKPSGGGQTDNQWDRDNAGDEYPF